mmetsp:Transcript_48859/g.116152  ORF Transcript_48859/g.116152 Transcript_48859/m.116152 type:complete len:114 (+) Transcript_48859:114-455(+)
MQSCVFDLKPFAKVKFHSQDVCGAIEVKEFGIAASSFCTLLQLSGLSDIIWPPGVNVRKYLEATFWESSGHSHDERHIGHKLSTSTMDVSQGSLLAMGSATCCTDSEPWKCGA